MYYFSSEYFLESIIITGSSIKCFVGNVTEAKPKNLVDCDTLGIQREELYCRNITIYQNGKESSVQRTCVAMSWYVKLSNPIIIGSVKNNALLGL